MWYFSTKQKSILLKEIKLHIFYLVLSLLFKNQLFTHDKDAVLLTAECIRCLWEKDITTTFYWVKRLQSKCICENSSSLLRQQRRRTHRDNQTRRRRHIKIRKCRQWKRSIIMIRRRENNHCKLLRQWDSDLQSRSWRFH